MEQQLEDDFTFTETAITLNGVVIEKTIILKSFQTFAEMFRPHFPIIGSLCPDLLYRSQPLLFWTIVVIIISRLPDQDCVALFQHLRDPYKKSLYDQVFVAPLPLYKVQALLLLCQWPLPVEKQPHDPSWLYAGLALHAARAMSLGRQEVISHMRGMRLGPSSILNRVNTWLGCFYVSMSLALQLGLTPSVTYDSDFPTAETFLQHQTTTLVFSLKVKIMAIAAKYTSLLRQATTDGTTTAIVRLLETDLDTVGAGAFTSHGKSLAMEMAVLDVKLHLLAQVLISSPSQRSSDRQVLLHKALGFASRLIQVSTTGFNSNATHDLDNYAFIRRQRCLPKGYGRALAFAAIFLLRFVHHIKGQDDDEQRRIASSIRLARDFFAACSSEPLDEYARTAKLLEVLETNVPKQSHLQPLCLTHRMGYSIVLDAMKQGAEVRGKPVPIQDDDGMEDSPAVTEGNWNSASLQCTGDVSVAGFQADWGLDFSWEFWGDPFIGTSVPFPDTA
ncbi:fungal specific transcription factor domain-containing protein [Sarocladium implicatum]|nr:fungal specific transcription factor domain-containing protein [Sarocladium implicatum]